MNFSESHLILKSCTQDFPIITRGEGVYLYDSSGRRYFDATAGLFVASVGHGNRELASEIFERSSRLAFVNSAYFTSEIAEELGERLAGLEPSLGLARSLFLCSGSEAVEAAIKLARQICVERGEERRHKIISRVPSYHGNTLFALSVSGRPGAQKMFTPLLADVRKIASPYAYRPAFGPYEQSAERYAGLLEDAIVEAGPESVAAFVVEPVSASAAAGDPPPPGYFDHVQRICEKYGVLIIADEVLCGSGRSGKFFASSHFGLKPDLLTMGKGISGGYVPLSVVLAREEHLDTVKRGSGSLVHFQTYQQAPAVAGAGVSILNYYERHGVVENCARMGARLKARLIDTVGAHPNVGYVAGTGLLLGIDIVEDKAAKRPFPRARKTAERLAETGLSLGLSFHPYYGHAAGGDGDFIMLSPPLTITEREVEELVGLVHETLRAYFH
ncbi:MAG TPA: aminotransferase class III-fold pyridoxal phosphate-dependent enzyme [Bdellovibrionales bacterium]|nr:aminotransferase class III-fold pyridoxal phosphate-dependent enzyme [Bdellovibrionales bacterium]